MSGQENLDIGRVVSLIMENPALIEQISSLAKDIPKEETPMTDEKTSEERIVEQTKEAETLPTYAPQTSKQNRAMLLSALKPYVSKERARAIDSMISIADILDMMKGR